MIVLVYIAVVVASLLVGIVASPLGSGGRALVQWGVNAAIAPITALSASVLYFALKDIREPATPPPPSAAPTPDPAPPTQPTA